MTNKKIINATALIYNNISFKSKFEILVYKTLSQLGFDVKYEPIKYTIWKGFKPTVPFYDRDIKTRMLKRYNSKLIDITYTPDFIIEYKGLNVIIEAKGYENDTFPLKKKLFRKWLENQALLGENNIYFEIYTKKQLMQAIDIIYATVGKDKEGNTSTA